MRAARCLRFELSLTTTTIYDPPDAETSHELGTGDRSPRPRDRQPPSAPLESTQVSRVTLGCAYVPTGLSPTTFDVMGLVASDGAGATLSVEHRAFAGDVHPAALMLHSPPPARLDETYAFSRNGNPSEPFNV